MDGSTSVAKELVEPGGGGYGGTLWNFWKNRCSWVILQPGRRKNGFNSFNRHNLMKTMRLN